MMALSRGLALWLGPLAGPPALGEGGGLEAPVARALFLGAGFTKATSQAAPLFSDYVEHARKVLDPLLDPLPDLQAKVRDAKKDEIKDKITELAEILHNVAGRRAVAEFFMSEPVGEHPALAPGAYQAWSSPMPPRGEATYRTLAQWQTVVRQTHPLHLSVLGPGRPPHLLGRMLAEGFFSQVLSTNWDAYVELGAWLVGLHVFHARDHGPARSEGGCLQVFESGRDVSLFPRRRGAVVLLKLHAGIDLVARVVTRLAEGQLTEAEAEQQLRAAFLVSTTDLTHWRDAAQWVHDAVSDGLRTHRVLFLGVSGADPVTFRAVRARVLEWEQAVASWWQEEPNGPSRQRPPQPAPLPLVAVDYSPSLRQVCMMSADQPRGMPAVQLIQGDGVHTMRAAYGWGLLEAIFGALQPHAPRLEGIVTELVTRLEREVDGPAPRPLLSLLCDALGPNARWAAIAEGRRPFDRSWLMPESRWWYAPWFGDGTEEGPAARALEQILACAAFLSRSRKVGGSERFEGVVVDEWTGVVQLPDWDFELEVGSEAGGVGAGAHGDDRGTGATGSDAGGAVPGVGEVGGAGKGARVGLSGSCAEGHTHAGRAGARSDLESLRHRDLLLPGRAGARSDLESLRHRDLLLLPWPWTPRVGIGSRSLQHALSETLHWLPGRTLDWVGSPRLAILPVGDPRDDRLGNPTVPDSVWRGGRRHRENSEPRRREPGVDETRRWEDEEKEARRRELREALPLAAGWSTLLPPMNWIDVWTLEPCHR